MHETIDDTIKNCVKKIPFDRRKHLVCGGLNHFTLSDIKFLELHITKNSAPPPPRQTVY